MDSEMRILEMALEREREIAEIRRRRLARYHAAAPDGPARQWRWPWRGPRQNQPPASRQISEPA